MAVKAWLRRHLPSRETLDSNPILRPFAHRLREPGLWRLNRSSVPRGVAVGLFVAIIIPFMHTIVAALLAVPVRANVALAAALTLLVNPLTIPPLYYAAYHLGRWELRHDTLGPDPAVAHQASSEVGQWLSWLLQASAPTALGIATLAVGISAGGYLLSALGWRWWIGRKWRARTSRREISTGDI